MKFIRLENGTSDRPISRQLSEAGVYMTDSCANHDPDSIWGHFCQEACEYYRVSGASYFTSPQVCGLCAHSDLMSKFYATKDPYTSLVTQNVVDGEKVVIAWPDMIEMGSSCVNLVGIDNTKTSFHNSCFTGDIRHGYTTNEKGLIHISCLIDHCQDWISHMLIVPHSIYTKLPLEYAKEFGVPLYVMRSPYYPSKRNTEIRLLMAHRKYRRERVDLSEFGEFLKNDITPHLATVITYQQAVDIKNKYRSKK